MQREAAKASWFPGMLKPSASACFRILNLSAQAIEVPAQKRVGVGGDACASKVEGALGFSVFAETEEMADEWSHEKIEYSDRGFVAHGVDRSAEIHRLFGDRSVGD